MADTGLSGKCAVITGGAGGIARASALLLAGEGATIVLVDIDRETAEGIALEIRSTGARSKAIIADITSGVEVDRMFSEAVEFMGGVDILINCVGGYKAYVNFEDISENEWDRILGINLKSVFLCCKKVVPLMKGKKWGRIINFGSLAGRSASSGTSPAHYASAKGAVSILTQYIAKEVAPFGITANTIAPGTTLTPRVDRLLTEDRREKFTKACPLGYLAQSEDIASVVMFLAGEGSRYITGATIDVNGGRLMLV